MNPNPKDTDPRTCNKCGVRADMGMTCVGPRCQRCGCDNARPFGEERESIWGPLHVEISEKTECLWGPLYVPTYEGREDW